MYCTAENVLPPCDKQSQTRKYHLGPILFVLFYMAEMDQSDLNFTTNIRIRFWTAISLFNLPG